MPDAQEPRKRAEEPVRPKPLGGPVDRKLLQEVLRRSLTLPGPAEEVLALDVEGLREVALRHHQEPLSLHPVTVELVESLLGTHFDGQPPAARGDMSPWRPMSEEIAQSLFEDTVFSERLRALWIRLGESAR